MPHGGRSDARETDLRKREEAASSSMRKLPREEEEAACLTQVFSTPVFLAKQKGETVKILLVLKTLTGKRFPCFSSKFQDIYIICLNLAIC